MSATRRAASAPVLVLSCTAWHAPRCHGPERDDRAGGVVQTRALLHARDGHGWCTWVLFKSRHNIELLADSDLLVGVKRCQSGEMLLLVLLLKIKLVNISLLPRLDWS